jgi:LCP family protein required for cell wall assembly
LPWVLLAVLLLVLAPIGYFGYGFYTTLSAISTADNPGGQPGGNELPKGDIHGTVFVLVMGSDERHDANGKVVSTDVPHSDTMILLAIDTDRHEVRMLSVPRDLVAEIPGYGKDHRINEAYTIGQTKKLPGGGAVLAVKTMEKLTGIQIPFYAVTTFDGFRQAVNAVGGVAINVDHPITDHEYPGEGDDYKPIYVAAGLQMMDGERALEYVRSRHDDPLSDFGRNQRQQRFLAAFSKRLVKPETFTRIGEFESIAKSNVSTNLSPTQILALGRAMLGFGKSGVRHYAIGPEQVTPATPSQYSIYGAVLFPKKAAIGEMVRAFTNGDPPPGSAAPEASPSALRGATARAA